MSRDAEAKSIVLAFPTRALLALGLVAVCVVRGEGAMADWSAIYLNGTLHSGIGLAAAGHEYRSLASLRISQRSLSGQLECHGR